MKERTLKERLDEIFRIILLRATAQTLIAKSQDVSDDTAISAVGYGLGLHSAVEVIMGEFSELYPSDDEYDIAPEATLKERLEEIMLNVEDSAAARIADGFPELFEPNYNLPGDAPVEPFTYIDQNDILFRDKYSRVYFWDETYSEVHGPYKDSPTAYLAMRKYAAELDGKTILESLVADQEVEF